MFGMDTEMNMGWHGQPNPMGMMSFGGPQSGMTSMLPMVGGNGLETGLGQIFSRSNTPIANVTNALTGTGASPTTIVDKMKIANKGTGTGKDAKTPGFWDDEGLGFNAGTLRLGLAGVQTLGNLWAASQAHKLAKEQFNFTKDVTNTNLNNNIQAYNTRLAGLARARGAYEGQSQQQVDAYVDANRAKRG